MGAVCMGGVQVHIYIYIYIYGNISTSYIFTSDFPNEQLHSDSDYDDKKNKETHTAIALEFWAH